MKKAAKAATKPKAHKEAIPEPLDEVWDDDVRTAFKALNPRQQNFLIEYLRTGVGATAYKVAYDPEASNHLAAAHGSRLVSNHNIQAVLKKFGDRKDDALQTVVKTYFDMANASHDERGEKPDWKTRKDGADGLSRIFGLNSPEKVQDDRFTALLEHMKQSKESA